MGAFGPRTKIHLMMARVVDIGQVEPEIKLCLFCRVLVLLRKNNAVIRRIQKLPILYRPFSDGFDTLYLLPCCKFPHGKGILCGRKGIKCCPVYECLQKLFIGAEWKDGFFYALP